MINRERFWIISVIAAFCRNTISCGRAGPAYLLVIAFLCLCMSATVLAQTQLGADIDGEAAGDQAGRGVSLSSDGSILAIGATYNSDNGDSSGHVRVYKWTDANWIQLGADINGEAAVDYSGGSISLSSDGSRLAIGAEGSDDNGLDSGHVRVFQWFELTSQWAQVGADIDGEAAGDQSGEFNSVSLSSDGNRLAIGAWLNNGNGDRSGHVRVFQWSSTSWQQLGADIDGEAAGDWSGRPISLSSDGSRLAIGAIRNDGNGVDSGHVRVYQWSDSSWQQLGSDIDGEAAEDGSGAAVSLSSNGNRLAIGAPNNDGNGVDSGHVRVYQWTGSVWTQVGVDINGEAPVDYSGGAVSLSSGGNRLVISAAENDAKGDMAGHVRVYQWVNNAWTQIGVDIDGEAAGDYSGEYVSLSSDGNRVAIGARWNDGNGSSSGHARVYNLSMFNTFIINAGLNDAWYFPDTDGQGFFINVFPDLNYVSLAWFTYDTELPPEDATANLGDPGHRWLTAGGPIDGNRVLMNIELTSGGIFDTSTEIIRTSPPGSDGTILLTFQSCNSGTVEYDIPSINRQGTVPIQRVAGDNIALCEVLNSN